MTVKESSATALVRFTGLGIICFNDALGRGEIAAVRDTKHKLSVRVQKPVFQEGGDVVVYQDIATYYELPKEGVQVDIKAVGSPAVEGYEIYRSGEFDRLGEADPNDFRWIVNMDSLHGDTALAPTAAPAHPVTRVHVANGLFYTHRLDTNLFFERVERDASGAETRRELFGNVAETIGVKIEGEAVELTITAGGRAETHTLGRVEGLPYRVEIKNMDYSDNAVYSDMADYYGYLASPDGSRCDFIPVRPDGADADSINQLQFCHPIGSNVSSIDELLASR